MCCMFLIIAFVVYYTLDKLIRSTKVGNFAQKYVFITGCDSGFGKRLAVRLDGMGFPVFAGCLTEEGRKFFTDNASSRLTTLSLDVTDSVSIGKALELIKEKLPQNDGLWAIVNNAGIAGPLVPAEFTPMKGLYKTCGVNLFGPVEICLKFMPLLRKSKGRVVNMASIMGRMACVGTSYGISKFGMEAFSDSLRRDMHDFGVKVSIVEPGFFMTEIIDYNNMKTSIETDYHAANEEVKAAYGDNFVEKVLSLLVDAREKANRNIDLVVDAYIHGIVSKYPRTRYVVGWDAWLLFMPLSYLPTGFADWLLRKHKKMSIAKHFKTST